MKRVLVTGGAAGIGFAIARRFVEEGWRVLTCDVDEAALNKALESVPGLLGLRCDCSKAAAVEAQ